MAKDKTEIKAKKRSKQKEWHCDEVAVGDMVVQKEAGTISTKRKKKKKERVIEENDISLVKEKKKKKSSDISVLCSEHIKPIESIDGNMTAEITKTEELYAYAETKKKTKKKNKLQQQKDTDCTGVDFGDEVPVPTLKQKKRKRKKKQTDEENGYIEENRDENTHEQKAENIPVEGETKKKKNKKAEEACVQFEEVTERQQKKKRIDENSKEDPSTSSSKQAEPKKGKRKKIDSSHVEDTIYTVSGKDLEIIQQKNAEGKVKKNKKQKDISVNTETPKPSLNHKEVVKKKRKKDKHTEQAVLQAEKDEGETTETVARNGKKSKKKQMDLSEEMRRAETLSPKLKKKKKKLSEENSAAKTVKQEERSVSAGEHKEGTEVVFLSEKPGNQDEILIDQKRRLALQRDVDQESQPKTTFGQWSTATFDNADQQQKFLRLMGGFKNSSQPLVSSAGRPNMAMAKEQQQDLHQKLIGQFQQAQNRKIDFSSRGVGLGFVVPSNKKFAIDVNASRSIKFDD